MATVLTFACPSHLPAQTNNALGELQALVAKINAKLSAGQSAETNLTPEIAEFDQLVEKHKAEKSDAASQILFAKVRLYVEVLGNPERGIALLQQLKSDFPETPLGKESDRIVADLQRQVEVLKLQRTLVAGAKFPDFEAKDLGGKTISAGQFKGKVVLVDFWATWCLPCQRELPNVRKAYEQYHDRGFEIIGITLDEDEQRLQGFLQAKKMAWPQIFEGKGWDCKLARQYAIQSIPSSFLLDPDGKIIARDLMGGALVEAVSKALPKTQASLTPLKN